MIEAVRGQTFSGLLDATLSGGRLQQTLTVPGAAASALLPVETIDFAEDAIRELTAELNDLLDLMARQRRPGAAGVVELKKLGAALWGKLLGPRLRIQLERLAGGALTLRIDEGLIAIPWEMLYGGGDFLCRRFALGRLVRTRQEPPENAARGPTGRSLLVVANPTGDLPGAQAELEAIRGAMRSFGGGLRIQAASGNVNRQFLLDNLSSWDFIHYSGHVEFDPDDPARSGLVLSDGIFSALEIRQFVEAGRKMPALLFANGCASGRCNAKARQLSVYNLSNAFLLGGVGHFIGTAALVPDEMAGELAGHFYRFLFQGASAGDALWQAREAAFKAHPELISGALSYILYGDPARSPLAGEETRDGARSAEASVKGRGEVRCAACGREILSRLSAAAQACEVCGLPLCQACWTGKGVRRCPQHRAAAEEGAKAGAKTEPGTAPAKAAPAASFSRAASSPPEAASPGAPQPQTPIETAPRTAPAATGRAPVRCDSCGRIIPSGGEMHTCSVEGCGQPICDRCWAWVDRRVCKEHALIWPERIKQARQRLQAGEIPMLLEREVAARREALYFRELRGRLAQSPTLVMNHARLSLAGPPAESSGEKELEECLARATNGARIAQYCPRNISLEARFQQAGLLSTKLALVLRVAACSDLENQVYPGFETRPLGSKVVQERLAQAGMKARKPGCPFIDVLVATSGWDGAARALATGGGGTELRQESGYVLVLVDLETDEVLCSPAHPLPPELVELVRPSTRVNVASELETHIRQTLTVGEFLTETELAERFRAQPAQVRAVFETLERGGDYEVREVRPVGLAITKKYVT